MESSIPCWILQNFAVNFLLVLCVAGGLHWYFYIRRGQKNTLKFDARDQTRNNRAFLFSNQAKDNMFWSLSSGVLHLTFFQQLNIADTSQFDFEKNLRGDWESFDSVRKLMPSVYRFRVFDGDRGEITEEDALNSLNDSTHGECREPVGEYLWEFSTA